MLSRQIMVRTYTRQHENVLVQVDAKMVRLEPQPQFEGLIAISRQWRRQSTGDEEIAPARMLDKIFRRSDAIDREALCIVAGERPAPPPSYNFANQKWRSSAHAR